MKVAIFSGLAVLFMGLTLAGCAAGKSANRGPVVGTMNQYGYIDVTPQEARALIEQNKDITIIDVSGGYALGHLPGAVSYYLGDGSLEKAIPALDKNKTYLVYCHSDSASIAGARMLLNAGFSHVYRLMGNYQAWVDAGYPMENNR